MMKRRILVVFEESDTGPDVKRQKKIAVLMDSAATNDDLAKEIAISLDREPNTFTLELPGGFELRGQDRILDTIRDDELVTARGVSSSPNLLIDNPVKNIPRSYPSKQGHIAESGEPNRIQIRLVTAQLARVHALATLKDGSATINSIFAFDGAFISGNTSLTALRREAARALGWISEDNMITDDDEYDCCDYPHDTGIACSCAVALEIERHGLFSTLHCRFTLDGQRCSHSDCPYSHANLKGVDNTRMPPHCTICGEFLGFPCPACMKLAADTHVEPSAVLHCPLVQNAGCGHLHHAHCLRMGNDDAPMASCPSGCPSDTFPREAVIFDLPTPRIIVAWDGDKIDYVPIPAPQGGFAKSAPLRLTSDEVVSLIRNFLSSKGFALPGLFLRIHSRDAITETVQLTQSTLVSICHTSTHVHQTHYRFQVFPDQTASSPSSPLSTKRPFHVDLHTSQCPIIACGCIRLQDLFCSEIGDQDSPTSVVLYAVKRMAETEAAPKRSTVSREWTYLFGQAWQPSVPQTARGMAALLSSLYTLTKLVPSKGVAAEGRVLSMLHGITYFPPAVRTLSILFLNRDAGSEERAALSEALYHALKDLLSCCARGAIAIRTNPDRSFEAVRILLAHIISAAGNFQPPSEPHAPRPVEEISLVCATSYKLLKNPILMDSQVVDRDFVMLHQLGGELWRPSSMSVISEMTDNEVKQLKRLLSYHYALPVSDSRFLSTMVFDVEKLGSVSSLPSFDLARVGRDFVGAIEKANKTDLVTRGPLDLKSANVIPPQIVLDQEGLLAVFTGRGCGTTRDVNFFRPTSGGDTEVDVNDVSYSLEKVIEQRRAEDTWLVDSFGGVSAAPTRPPDEAIVLCLDLSESMNKQSGVSRPMAGHGVLEEDEFDHETASFNLLHELVEDVSEDVILENAKGYLRKQHPRCHQAWRFYLQGDSGSEDVYTDDARLSSLKMGFLKRLLTKKNKKRAPNVQNIPTPKKTIRLLYELGVMARRDALNLSLTLEADRGNPRMKNKMLESAHFATACDQHSTELASFLSGFLDELSDGEDVGVEPYQVPRRLIDPKTGDLLLDPVLPDNAPNLHTFVNEESRGYFEAQAVWPTRSFASLVPHFSDVAQVREAVAEWISGKDILPVKEAPSLKGKEPMRGTLSIGSDVQVTLVHEGEATVWDLSISTSTRTLYCLANRATKARYSRFTLRLTPSKAVINDSANLTLGLTDLSHGGVVEISFAVVHKRKLSEVVIRHRFHVAEQKVLLPQDAPILALIGYLEPTGFGNMSDMQLWHGLKAAGDGVRRGTLVENTNTLTTYGYSATYEFDCETWTWREGGVQRERETTRYLNRLDVLKELFNVFINRASSFDTSVSLVLGLVTFSDKASVEQELTPIFESFRQRLDKVFAGGNTVVYDALDAARRMLMNYRSDLPQLRKRIIIVTDGADTGSEASAKDVCHALQKNNIIVDSVQVGQQSDNTLHAVSVATGGYRFCPQTSLSDALSIFDLETMLSSAERTPRLSKRPVLNDITLRQYGSTLGFPVDIVTISQFPHRAPHEKLQQTVKPAAKLIAASPTHDDRTKRIMRELKALTADPHPQIDLYVNDSDISFLKIILEAPKDETKCPYRNGTFLLTCDIPQNYPRDPPEIRFVTFILHPNVSKQGKVCVAELGRLWSSDITLKEIFSLIYGLLLEPDLENPLEIQASLKYYDDDGTFVLAVADAVAEHASKSREHWRLELASEEQA